MSRLLLSILFLGLASFSFSQISTDLLKDGTTLIYEVGELNEGSTFGKGKDYFEKEKDGELILEIKQEIDGSLWIKEQPLNFKKLDKLIPFTLDNSIEEGSVLITQPKDRKIKAYTEITDTAIDYYYWGGKSITVIVDGEEKKVSSTLYHHSSKVNTDYRVIGISNGSTGIMTHLYFHPKYGNGAFFRLAKIYSPENKTLAQLKPTLLADIQDEEIKTEAKTIQSFLQKELTSITPKEEKNNKYYEIDLTLDENGGVFNYDISTNSSTIVTKFKTVVSYSKIGDSLLRDLLNKVDLKDQKSVKEPVRYKLKLYYGNDWLVEFDKEYNYDFELHSWLASIVKNKQSRDFNEWKTHFHPIFWSIFQQDQYEAWFKAKHESKEIQYDHLGMKVLKVAPAIEINDTTYQLVVVQEDQTYYLPSGMLDTLTGKELRSKMSWEDLKSTYTWKEKENKIYQEQQHVMLVIKDKSGRKYIDNYNKYAAYYRKYIPREVEIQLNSRFK